MNHLEHFGFVREPFSLSPATLAFYNSAQHAGVVRTVSQMLDSREQFAIVQGVAGSGKTTVAYQIISQLSAELYGRAYIPCAATMQVADVAALAGLQLSGEVSNNLAQAIDRSESEQVLVILDDADCLAPPVLSALLKTSGQAKFLLLGCDMLKIAANLGNNKALLINLAPLSEKGTAKYIKNRLRSAGGDPELFQKEAIAAVYKRCNGNPAAINLNCERLLVMAAAANAECVKGDLARAVLAVTATPAAVAAPNAAVGMTFEDEPTIDAAANDLAERELAGAVSALDDLADSSMEDDQQVVTDSKTKDVTTASKESHQPLVNGNSPEDSDDLDALLDEFELEAEPATTLESDADERQVVEQDQSEVDEFAALAQATSEDNLTTTKAEGDDVDVLLAEFEASEASKTAPAQAAPESDLDELLADLDKTPSPAPAAPAAPASKANTQAVVSPSNKSTSDVNDELDTLLVDLQAAKAPAPSQLQANSGDDVDLLLQKQKIESESELDVALEVEDDPRDDADVDSLLSDLASEQEQAAPAADIDELDALLNQLEDKPAPPAPSPAKAAAKPADKAAPKTPAKSTASTSVDSELDDLLSQIDELQES